MKQLLFLFILLPGSLRLLGQTSYTGSIDSFPVELVTNIYTDGDARAVYAYTRLDEPIVLTGRLKQNRLTLYETDKSGKATATLVFPDYRDSASDLNGSWTEAKSGRQRAIRLRRAFSLDYGEGVEYTDRELLQQVALKDRYFRLVVSKAKDDFTGRVTGVKIIEKKTDRLLQYIALDCHLNGLSNVQTGDFNFDGPPDFSVFEQSYAGPNTSSLYFLYNPKTGKFFDSGFEGTSLEFDRKTKRIYEHNQCCAGTSHMNAEYKVVNNRMVLVKKTCTAYSERKCLNSMPCNSI
ncbi:MAG: hypothetical protein EOP50_05670 [Sphingobacteriales bacterium]|nr:MAG: hypothetical protein EOP50_05670 [Sphingobacteriales bacterium]